MIPLITGLSKSRESRFGLGWSRLGGELPKEIQFAGRLCCVSPVAGKNSAGRCDAVGQGSYRYGYSASSASTLFDQQPQLILDFVTNSSFIHHKT